MRRDFLELDASLQRPIAELGIRLDDVEAIRLMLSGGSVVDWERAAFDDYGQVDRFLGLHKLDMTRVEDRERLRFVFNESVSYLEEHLKMSFPSDLRAPDDVRDVFLVASHRTPGKLNRRQIQSCAILKLMHVIHHMEVADLKFKTAISEEELMELAYSNILKTARRLREEGMPVVSFYGSRKTRTSIITKLLAKKDNVATTIFDKLRFRIVVPLPEDLVPALTWLARSFFPFNYVIPGQSHNNLLDPNEIWEWMGSGPSERPQALKDEPGVATDGKNEFSGATYRMINFIVDYPVRLPERAGPYTFDLGNVVYVMVEFQLLDEETARLNEQGDNAHHRYKLRQRSVVAERLGRSSFRQVLERDDLPEP